MVGSAGAPRGRPENTGHSTLAAGAERELAIGWCAFGSVGCELFKEALPAVARFHGCASSRAEVFGRTCRFVAGSTVCRVISLLRSEGVGPSAPAGAAYIDLWPAWTTWVTLPAAGRRCIRPTRDVRTARWPCWDAVARYSPPAPPLGCGAAPTGAPCPQSPVRPSSVGGMRFGGAHLDGVPSPGAPHRFGTIRHWVLNAVPAPGAQARRTLCPPRPRVGAARDGSATSVAGATVGEVPTPRRRGDRLTRVAILTHAAMTVLASQSWDFAADSPVLGGRRPVAGPAQPRPIRAQPISPTGMK